METQQRAPTVERRSSNPRPTDTEEVHFERRTTTLMAPRYAKLEFPSYDDSGDPLG